ncbi:hypothetical protein AB836_01310 [Rickettsiales bacterium (ex Bugula neritina AB1)]|nr:hypothetical protein AB836_01310 [Rickettsiales bacterium (ex Bugula neritina AB1)]
MKIYFNIIGFLFIFCFTQKSIKEYLSNTEVKIFPFYLINSNNRLLIKIDDNEIYHLVIMGCELFIPLVLEKFNNYQFSFNMLNHPNTKIFIEYENNKEIDNEKYLPLNFRLTFYDNRLKIICDYCIGQWSSTIKGTVNFSNTLSIFERFCGCFFPNKNKEMSFKTNISLFMNKDVNSDTKTPRFIDYTNEYIKEKMDKNFKPNQYKPIIEYVKKNYKTNINYNNNPIENQSNYHTLASER